MAKRKRNRDYAKEYERRLERGKKQGLSRSQARGHPRKREKPISAMRRNDSATPMSDLFRGGIP